MPLWWTAHSTLKDPHFSSATVPNRRIGNVFQRRGQFFWRGKRFLALRQFFVIVAFSPVCNKIFGKCRIFFFFQWRLFWKYGNLQVPTAFHDGWYFPERQALPYFSKDFPPYIFPVVNVVHQLLFLYSLSSKCLPDGKISVWCFLQNREQVHVIWEIFSTSCFGFS